MSDKTLSQRLREIAASIPTRMSMNDPGWSPSEVAEMIRAIAAQAEAQEAQAGELSDEVIGRAAMDSIPADSHVGLALDQDGAIDMARAFFERGMRYARDNGYLRPSQAIGEHTPVAWIYEDTLPEGYPYDAMFPYSEVRDFVRMFPVYGPPPMSSDSRDKAIEALVAALSAIRPSYGATRNKVNQALSSLRG